MVNTSVEMLRKLISFDTTSRNSNLALIEWIADFLNSRGAHVELAYNASKDKANLLGSIGPDREGGVVLSGHTDVVPVDGQAWTSDPFALVERDGRFFGRGTSDMKGFIACSLAAVEHWKCVNFHRPLHFAFSYDEEVGCIGAHALVDLIARSVPKPAFAIIGEPTDMRIGVAHNGVTASHTTFRGVAAHASEPSRGMNAIGAAADFVRYLREVSRLPEIADGGCTFNVGLIAGGIATNIVAECCSVRWEYRADKQEDTAVIHKMIFDYIDSETLAALDVKSDVEVDVPPFHSGLGDESMRLLRRWGAKSPGIRLPFGSEAGVFESSHIPSVVCGPGSIDQAHRPDEWISRAALDEADEFLSRVGTWARQNAPD